MIILIDNYDSFTFNIYHYISEIGGKVYVFRNDNISVNQIIKMKPSAIILSPGPCTPNEAGICLDIIKNCHNLFPILGICLGHQSIGQAFGGKIKKCEEIMHGKIGEIIHNGHPIFSDISKEFSATRYHSLIVEKKSLPECLEISATSNDGLIMGLRHRRFPIEGVQFHPESILTDHGKKLLKNFLGM